MDSGDWNVWVDSRGEKKLRISGPILSGRRQTKVAGGVEGEGISNAERKAEYALMRGPSMGGVGGGGGCPRKFESWKRGGRELCSVKEEKKMVRERHHILQKAL